MPAGKPRRPQRHRPQEVGPNRGAPGGRRRRIKPISTTEDGRPFEEKYPNLAAEQERDRQIHVKAARGMGATRRQASEHADEEVGAH